MWKKRYRTSGTMLKTGLNSGRIAGDGMLHDNYSEESGNRRATLDEAYPLVRLPHDKDRPEDLNGPVIIVQEGRKKP